MAARSHSYLPLSDVVITGVGLVAPFGVGACEAVGALRSGRSGVSINAEDVGPWRLQAFVPESFDPKQFVKLRKSLKVMSHETQLGVSAANMAMTDAGLAEGSYEPSRMGVILGTDIMHCPPSELIPTYRLQAEEPEFNFGNWSDRAHRELNPLWMLKYLPNMASSHIAIAHDAQGPSNSLVLGDVSGLLAISEGASLITRGWADIVIAGGTGSLRNPTTRMYHGTNHLSRCLDEPIATPRPFDPRRDGSVAGEGAGIVILERRSSAAARGARIYGSLHGVGQGMVHRPDAENSSAIELALSRTLQQAAWNESSIDHVNAAGRATQQDDRREARALQRLLPQTPVVAPSSFSGILGAASGAVELIVSLLLMSQAERPYTLHSTRAADDCPIQLQTEVCAPRTQRFIKISHAWTGQAVAIACEAASS